MKKRRLSKEAKEWIKAIIEAPFVIAAVYFIYCFMYVVIGG